ncbi:MAG TPA: fructosamine kinase [Phycisphaerales bacterium]|nr:fructosamine kinase [Phycisphaerales bacterium]
MKDERFQARVAEALGVGVRRSRPLGGGCVADVRALELTDGERAVVKCGSDNARLDIEAMMLETLAATGAVPVPAVLHSEPGLLVMEHIEADGTRSTRGETDAADMIAALHSITQHQFGFEQDTLIGGLPQPNRQMDDWPRFFADRRLLFMGRRALDMGRLPGRTMDRLERLAADIDRFIIPPPSRPGLIHGDVWSGNVLWHRGRIAALIDPAIYYADPEIELAFIDLFGCFGRAFWDRYAEAGEIRDGFFEVRKDLYNLYPLLVHTSLFGGGYADSAARSLDTLGV